MSDSKNDEVDRIAGGTAGDTGDTGNGENNDVMPGITGGAPVYLPSDGRGEQAGTTAASADNTVGAVGEMDFTGSPAGTSGAGDVGAGSGAGSSVGGGTGGGSMSSSGETGVDKE